MVNAQDAVFAEGKARRENSDLEWRDIQRVAQQFCESQVRLHVAEAFLSTAIYTNAVKDEQSIRADMEIWQHQVEIKEDALGILLNEPTGELEYASTLLATRHGSTISQKRPDLSQYDNRRTQITDRYRYGIYHD